MGATTKSSQAWEWIRQRQKTDERINELFDTIGKIMYLEELLVEYEFAFHAPSEECSMCQQWKYASGLESPSDLGKLLDKWDKEFEAKALAEWLNQQPTPVCHQGEK